jgi:hypothetical protein
MATGASSAIRPIRRSSSPNSRDCASGPASPASSTCASSSGSRRDSSPRPEARTSSRSSRTTSARSVRSTSTIGAYGSSLSPRSRHAPTATRAPVARARLSNSAASRLLPTPDSPPTSTVLASPAAAPASASSSSRSSSRRPTRSGLEIRRAIAGRLSPFRPRAPLPARATTMCHRRPAAARPAATASDVHWASDRPRQTRREASHVRTPSSHRLAHDDDRASASAAPAAGSGARPRAPRPAPLVRLRPIQWSIYGQPCTRKRRVDLLLRHGGVAGAALERQEMPGGARIAARRPVHISTQQAFDPAAVFEGLFRGAGALGRRFGRLRGRFPVLHDARVQTADSGTATEIRAA